MPTVLLHITGKVQGVYYRQSTRKKALSLGICGYVKNLPDRSVEVCATGDPDQLRELINWCHTGPPAARVEEVIVKEVKEERMEGFDVRK